MGALALAELEALASAGATGLLALLHAGVTSEETLLAESGAVLFIDHDKGASNGKAHSAGLAVDTTTLGDDANIILLDGVGSVERLQNNVLKSVGREVFLEAAAVDGDLAGLAFFNGGEPSVGDSLLAAACSVVRGGRHDSEKKVRRL